MQTITGTVNDISPFKTGTGKRGPWTLWQVDIDGTVVKAGFQKPGFNVGDQVTLQVAQNKYGDLEMIQPGKPVGGRQSSPAPTQGGSGSAGGRGFERTFPVKPDSPEMAIIRQNALTNANATLALFFDTNDVPPSVSEQDLAELVIDIAYKYAKFSSGQREVEIVNNMKKQVA